MLQKINRPGIVLCLIFLGLACVSRPPMNPSGTGAKSEINFEERFIQSEGAQLKTFVYGGSAGNDPKVVILLHGGPGLPGYMRSLGELLSDHFTVVEY